MTTRDDARRTTSEPRGEGLRLVPPRPEPHRSDDDGAPDRGPERDHETGPARDGERAAGSRPAPLPERLYAARER